MRYLVVFKYDGVKFHGFQRQNDVRNVQGELETVLSKVLGKKIMIKGAGRTDAGVHAICQCAHFDYDKKIGYKELKSMNKFLNNDIFIKDIKRVKDTFHARYSVRKKTYVYKIYNGIMPKEKEGYYYQINYKLKIRDMKKTAKILIGAHDYHNFVSGERDDYSTIIYKISIKKRGRIITMKFVGAGFYRYMVRHLVGAILDVGKGKATTNDVKIMLDKPDVPRNLSIVPAEGLYLVKVKY